MERAMPLSILVAVILIVVAFVAYAVGVVVVRRQRRITALAALALAVGLLSDVPATALMHQSASATRLTLHSFLGYAGVVLMGLFTLMALVQRRQRGAEPIPDKLARFGLVAWVVWLVAFAGGVLTAISRRLS
jgi:uncharacterized repeat protein (TIGR03987 family)